MVVRQYYEQRDLRGILRSYAKVFAAPPWNETWTEQQIREELDTFLKQEGLDFRVALRVVRAKEPEVIGFSVSFKASEEVTPELGKLLPLDRTAYGKELVVNPEFQGRGIGSRMLEERVARYRRLGFRYLAGRTDLDSKMVPVYKKFDYRYLGILNPDYPRRGYWVKDLQGLGEVP